ncbi:MAG: DapH/DapD/GlmU-related protein [Alphaproteobacteria bacterium]
MERNLIGVGTVFAGAPLAIGPYAVIGQEPMASLALAHHAGRQPPTRIGLRAAIGAHAVIYRGVVVGDDCLIGDGANIREACRLGDRVLIGRHVSINYETRIGSRVRIMDGAHITGRCEIGDDSFIGMNVTTSNDRHVDPVSYEFRDAVVRGPRIGRGVMIGSGANILAGVTIGDGAIVGSHAFVDKDVPAGGKVFGHRCIRHASAGSAA